MDLPEGTGGRSAHKPKARPLVDALWLSLFLAQILRNQLVDNDRHAQVCIRQHQHPPACAEPLLLQAQSDMCKLKEAILCENIQEAFLVQQQPESSEHVLAL